MAMRKRPLEILRAMKAAEDAENYADAEIVCSGIDCWLGDDRVSRRSVRYLLDHVAISYASEPGSMDRYVLNGTGRAILEDPTVDDRVQAALAKGVNVNERGYPVDDFGRDLAEA